MELTVTSLFAAAISDIFKQKVSNVINTTKIKSCTHSLLYLDGHIYSMNNFFFNDEIEFGSTPVVEKFYLIFQPIN